MEPGTKAAQDRPVPAESRGGFFSKLGKWFRPSAREGNGPEIHFGGFGKHPGWDDHVLDLGIETDGLAWVQRTFYVRGIGENIDNSAWDQLTADQRLADFRHAFLWRKGRDLFAGRLWASIDSKNRARYPMVLCTQCTSIPLDWVVSVVPAHLEQAMRRCRETTSAADVREAVASTQAALRVAWQSHAAAAPPPGQAPGQPLGRAPIRPGIPGPFDFLADRPELGPDRRGLLSILYEVEREMAAYRPAAPNAPSQITSAVPRHIRVPGCGLPAFEAARVWIEFLAALLSPSASLLALHPIDEPWLDLIVGDPTPDDLFCMMATPKKVPYTSDIPHKLDEEFLRRANRQIDQNRQSAPPGAPGAPGAPNLPKSPIPA